MHGHFFRKIGMDQVPCFLGFNPLVSGTNFVKPNGVGSLNLKKILKSLNSIPIAIGSIGSLNLLAMKTGSENRIRL
ncbi:MAG: hypothetical protein HC803_01965 [Saprospiraceae bacterium]|nr:hypothetical protein [Saprospiraceae bacterium]